MLTPQALQGSYEASFVFKPKIIRDPNQILTTSYVLCQDHDDADADIRNGDIQIGSAALVTLFLWAKFGSLTSIEIQPRFVTRGIGLPIAAKTDYSATGVAKHFLVNTADVFTRSMIDEYILVTDTGAGGAAIPGIYKIIDVTSSKTAQLDRDVVTTSETGIDAVLPVEAKDCSQVTTGGSTALSANEFTLSAGEGDGKFSLTFPVPAASTMRIHAKGSGTATLSDLVVAYGIAPAGSQ